MKFDTQLIVIINLDWMSVTHSQLNIAYNLYTYIRTCMHAYIHIHSSTWYSYLRNRSEEIFKIMFILKFFFKIMFILGGQLSWSCSTSS